MSNRGSPPGGGELTVLLIDDYAAYVTAGREYLESVDDAVTVLPETSGESALRRVSRDAVDCVVSDYRMPGMDGVELLETLREDHPRLPFVLLTGNETERLKAELSDDVTDVLRKGSGTHTFRELRVTVREVASAGSGFRFDNATG